jgi:hypothetical protein
MQELFPEMESRNRPIIQFQSTFVVFCELKEAPQLDQEVAGHGKNHQSVVNFPNHLKYILAGAVFVGDEGIDLHYPVAMFVVG